MTARRRFLELVFIKWIDSETEVGWDELGELEPLRENLSVGYIVGQNAEVYALAADYDPETDHFNRVIKIPRECVRKLRVVTIIPLPKVKS